MKRLLLADALGRKPASSDYRYLLSSSRAYGLTEGTEKATEISLTKLGARIIQAEGPEKREALQTAVLQPAVFRSFFTDFNGNKLPSNEMLQKLLVSDYGIEETRAEECAELIIANGTFVGVIREISGSQHVLLDTNTEQDGDHSEDSSDEGADGLLSGDEEEEIETQVAGGSNSDEDEAQQRSGARPIFLGHGGKTGPLEKVQKLLSSFQVPHRVATSEANLGRPIPTKVKETMQECGSAILIFTRDELLYDEEGNKIWRPSQNVVHELGAASYAYDDRVVVFKENGISLPSNFSSIGYIEFDEDGIESKTADLLQELIGFGLVRLTPTG